MNYLKFKYILSTAILVTTLACSNQGFVAQTQQQVFSKQLQYNNKVDILWVVDSSESMQKYQEKINDEIESLFNSLDGKKLDYRMAAITMDVVNTDEYSRGRLIGSTKVIKNETANKKAAFNKMILPPATNISLERGLASLKLALSEDMLDSYNKGFLRDEAYLAIIVLSDENDYSDGNTAEYVHLLDELKPQKENRNKGWVANFIGIIKDDPLCSTYYGIIDVGTRYMDLVSASNGTNFNICDSNLSTAIKNINIRLEKIMTDYPLETKPNVATIKVWVDGVLLEQNNDNGWSYNEDKNVVSFHGSAVPAADVEIKIDYKPWWAPVTEEE